MLITYDVAVLPLLANSVVLCVLTIMVVNMYLKTNIQSDKHLSLILAAITAISFLMFGFTGKQDFWSAVFHISTIIMNFSILSFSYFVHKKTLKDNVLHIILTLIITLSVFMSAFISGLIVLIILAISAGITLIIGMNSGQYDWVKISLLGTLTISLLGGHLFGSDAFKMLYSLSILVVLLIECSRYFKRVTSLFKSATVQSVTDPLTGLFNKGYLFKKVKQLSSIQEFSVTFIDIDDFKKYNDEHGHKYGDEVLINIGKELQLIVGSNGRACRFGGEELVVITALDLQSTVKLAESIRAKIEKNLNITVSIGVACSSELETTPSLGEETIKLAEDRMYYAKNNGKNQVSISNTQK